MSFDPAKPFNDLPKLPPATQIETVEVLRKVASARAALGELKGAVQIIPDATILINNLLLEEARDSSEIENIVTTRDNLYRALAVESKNVDPVTKEVLRYRTALWKGYESTKKKGFLSTNMILDIQKELVENNAGIRKLPGTALMNDKTGETIYTPPDGESNLRELLANLETYLNANNGTDPLIRLAVLHYQFEAIHPFYDGNGRTGRIINVLFLTLSGLLNLPILYLSRGIIERRSDYYRLLSNVTTSNSWEEWILFMLNVVETTAGASLKNVEKVKNLLDRTVVEVKERLPKIYSKELVELVFQQPYTKIQHLVTAGVAKRQTAAVYLDRLVKIGVLKKAKAGKEVVFLNKRLFDVFGRK